MTAIHLQVMHEHYKWHVHVRASILLCTITTTSFNATCTCTYTYYSMSLASKPIQCGRPLPLLGPGRAAWGSLAPDLGFLIVSSTERIRAAASEAAVRALILTTAGSQTQASKLSAMSSFMMSTPNHRKPGVQGRDEEGGGGRERER